MISRHTLRRAVAVPAALTLALGGALLGTTAASAAPGDLDVTYPIQGETTTGRTFDVVGTAPVGTIVTVDDVNTDLTLNSETVDDSGAFSISVTYAGTADVSQAIDVTSVLPGTTVIDETVTRDFVLPAADLTPVPPVDPPVDPAPPVDPPVETVPFAVTEPTPGTPLESRTVTFAGTGTDDSTVTATDAAGAVLGGPVTVVDGAWSLDAVFADDASVDQTVTFTQLTDGVETGVFEAVLTLPTAVQPIPAPATPVFTAPVQGEVVVGDRITFQGTGTPGSDIGIISVPTAEYEAALEQVSTLAQPVPQPAPVDPTARIVVGEDGTWSVTIEQVPGEYTAVAFSALLDEAGDPVIDPTTTLPVVSGDSEPLAYSIVAAVVPAGTAPVAVPPAHSALAYTGAETAGGALGLAAALALAGTALTLVARRRRALAAVGTSGE